MSEQEYIKWTLRHVRDLNLFPIKGVDSENLEPSESFEYFITPPKSTGIGEVLFKLYHFEVPEEERNEITRKTFLTPAENAGDLDRFLRENGFLGQEKIENYEYITLYE